MKLRLVREEFTEDSTIGRLTVDGVFECYTLEDKDRKLEAGGVKVKHETAIPRGTYTIERTYSPRFLKVLPLLVNVPQFEGIRIHPGNTKAHTSGCILLGRVRKPNRIEESTVAFQSLDAKIAAALARGEPVSIEVV